MNRLTPILIAVLVASLATAAFAQKGAPLKGGSPTGQKALGKSGPGGQDRAAEFKKRQVELFTKLGLNASQKKKVEALMAQQMKDVKALMDAPGDRASKRAKFEEMRKKNDAALKKILTSTQYKKLQEMRPQRRPSGGGAPGKGGPSGKPGGKGG